MTISLRPDLARFVEGKVQAGRYADPSAVIEDALALLRITPRSSDELREMVETAVAEADRGELEPLDTEATKAEARRRLTERRSGS